MKHTRHYIALASRARRRSMLRALIERQDDDNGLIRTSILSMD